MAVGDRAVRSFIKYARLCPDAGELSYFEICERIRGCMKDEASAFRMLAVYDTLRLLEANGKGVSADAVRYVYFDAQGRTPRKNEISFRVLKFASLNYMDVRTVWRRISEAKELYLNLLKQQNLNFD